MRPRTLAEFTGPVRPSGNHLNYKVCPVCGHEGWKVYVNPDTGGWNCNAGRCGARGFIDVALDPEAPGADIMRRLHPDTSEHEWEEIELPEWEPLQPMAQRYLELRGIDADLAAKLGIVEVTDKFRVLFPYFDREGTLIYWNSRAYNERLAPGPKYIAAPGKHPLYYLEGDTQDTLVIVEGVFDAIACHRAGYSAVALGGKSLPKYLRRPLLRISQSFTNLLVALDPDAMADAIKLQNQLADVQATRLVLLPLDPADMETADLRRRLNEG